MFAQSAETPRTNGPRARLDPHTPPSGAPAEDPAGRSVLYVGDSLATSACEVFGEAAEARICPSYRVALLRPVGGLTTFDLTAPGAAMAIGALPSLADGAYPRSLTQDWAHAIYEDNPTGYHPDGIRYTSAYNGGRSLALWGSIGRVAVVRDSRSVLQDFALADPAVLPRLQVALKDRRIHLTQIAASDCPDCPDCP